MHSQRKYLAPYMWVSLAKPGDRYVYHRGCLSQDRVEKVGAKGLVPTPVGIRALMARDLADLGYVTLTQEKLDDGTYNYWATRTAKDWAGTSGGDRPVSDAGRATGQEPAPAPDQ